jgi:hypothetical protein
MMAHLERPKGSLNTPYLEQSRRPHLASRFQETLLALANAIGINRPQRPFSGRHQLLAPGPTNMAAFQALKAQDTIDQHLERMRKREQAMGDIRAEELIVGLPSTSTA